MRRLLQKPYGYWVVGTFLFYVGLNVYLSDFYETVKYLAVYASQVHWGKLILGMVFTAVIGALVSVNMISGYIRYKERKEIKKSGALACLGTIGGLAIGVCSSCVTSVFPLVLGLVGVTFSWASLPFQGLEIQALTIVILGVGLWWMWK